VSWAQLGWVRAQLGHSRGRGPDWRWAAGYL